MGLRYNPAIDGLRALACLAVVVHHADIGWLQGGSLGVEVFFVLSGFLITRVLSAHRPSLSAFYLARAQRLMPALLAMLAVYLAVFPFIRPGEPHLRDAAVTALYMADITKLLFDWPEYLGHAWSLGIEEKFYLLWPLVFFRWRPTQRTLLLAFVLATAWRFHSYSSEVARLRFDLHLSGLILGCAIAHAPRLRTSAWPGLLVIGACMFYLQPANGNTRMYGVGVVELATAYVLLTRAPKLLEVAPLRYMGKLSYGIYLWHYPIACVIPALHWPPLANLAVTLVIATTAAALSYHTIEAPFRRRRALASGRRDQVGVQQRVQCGNLGAGHRAVSDVSATAAALPRSVGARVDAHDENLITVKAAARTDSV